VADPRLLELLGASSNEQLKDAAIRHAIFIERFKGGVSNRTLAFLNDQVYPDLLSTLERRLQSGAGTFGTKRLQAMQREMDEILRVGFQRSRQNLVSNELFPLAGDEAQRVMDQMASSTPIDMRLLSPDPATLRSIVTSRPFQGRHLREWYGTLTRSTQQSVRQQVNIGIAQGESIGSISRRLRGTRAARFADGVLQTSRRSANAIARTAVNHVVTNAREETYKANEDVVKGVQYVATLDSRTTDICASLDGKVFPVDEGERPPQHMQCRSTTVPILKSWKELGIDLKEAPEGTRASMNGQVPATLNYNGWLRKMDASPATRGIVDDALGPRRAELFRSGVNVDKFVNAQGKTLTLRQLGHSAAPSSGQDVFERTLDGLTEAEKKARRAQQSRDSRARKKAGASNAAAEAAAAAAARAAQAAAAFAAAQAEATAARAAAARAAQAQAAAAADTAADTAKKRKASIASKKSRARKKARDAGQAEPVFDAEGNIVGAAGPKVTFTPAPVSTKFNRSGTKRSEDVFAITDDIDTKKGRRKLAIEAARNEESIADLLKEADSRAEIDQLMNIRWEGQDIARPGSISIIRKRFDFGTVKSVDGVREIALAFDNIAVMFGDKALTDTVKQFTVESMGRATAGMQRFTGSMRFNKKYLTTNGFNKLKNAWDWDKVARERSPGQRPSVWTRDNTTKGVINHEFGHGLDFGAHHTQFRGVRDWLDLNPPKGAYELSSYGMTNRAEQMAEAISGVLGEPQTQWTPWMRKFAVEFKKSIVDMGYRIPRQLRHLSQ
tara:strand:- start:54560 stop:56911 length:2352 start_codon:yes stop_codon:yes gene_type:complete